MDIISRIFKGKEARRTTRFKIQNFHNITFWINEDEFDVYNVSLEGLGFLIENKDFEFVKNKKIHAAVKVLDKVCDIEVELKFKSENLIGCNVVGSCDIYSDFVKEIFESELEALKLRNIPNDKMAKDENGEPHWFYGDYNHELYFTVNSNKINSFHVNYHGYMFIYDNGKTSTGLVREEIVEEIAHKGSEIVQESKKLPKEIMEYMYRFVEMIPELDSNYKKEILKILKDRFGLDWDV